MDNQPEPEAGAAGSHTKLEAGVAELESALKKAAEKEAAATAKAQGKPTVNVVGVINVDTAAFSQDADSQQQFPPGTDVRNYVAFRAANHTENERMTWRFGAFVPDACGPVGRH